MTWLNKELELQIEKVAHGGIFVARHEGRVVFVTGAIPGETVRAKVYEDAGGSFARATVTEVLQADPDRKLHFWKAAREGAGGAEFGHIALARQRTLKADVLEEALARMSGLQLRTEVEAAPGDDETGGQRYRSRVSLNVDSQGNAGPYRERSHEVVQTKDLPLAMLEIEELGLHLKNWSGVSKIHIAASSTGGLQWQTDAKKYGSETLVERVGGRTFRLSPGAFWQVHSQAAEILSQGVIKISSELGFDPEALNLDLYAGAGLFSSTLSGHYGGKARFTAIEAHKGAVEDGKRSTRDLENLNFVRSDVMRLLREMKGQAVDTVVLDPPRSGAGNKVVAAIHDLKPRNLIYVACDPVALARDLGQLATLGYSLKSLRAIDIFPNTHHFEMLAAITRD